MCSLLDLLVIQIIGLAKRLCTTSFTLCMLLQIPLLYIIFCKFIDVEYDYMQQIQHYNHCRCDACIIIIITL